MTEQKKPVLKLEQYTEDALRFEPLPNVLSMIQTWEENGDERAGCETPFNPDRVSGTVSEKEQGLLHSCDDGAKTWLSADMKGLCTCGETSANEPCRHINSLLIYRQRQEVVIRKNSEPHAGERAVSVKRMMGRLTMEVEGSTPFGGSTNLMASLAPHGQPTGLNASGVMRDGYWYYTDTTREPNAEKKKVWVRIPIETARLVGDINGAAAPVKAGTDRIWVPENRLLDITEIASSGRMTLPPELDRYVKFANRQKRPMKQPKGLIAKLDDAQLEGVAWLQDLFEAGLGGLVCDEMGVGKTMQVLGHIQSLHNMDEKDDGILLAVPSGAIDQWVDEMRENIPEIEFIVWEGPKREGLRPLIDETPIVLTTHALLTVDIDMFKSKRWAFIGVDEAQDGNNPTSNLAVSWATIPAKQKLPITGTPVENSLVDFHTLMSISNPGLLGSRAAFVRDIVKPTEAVPGEKDDPSILEEEAERVLDQLHKVTGPFILHRTQQEAGLNVPTPEYINIPIEMEDRDRELYEAVWRTMMDEGNEKGGAFRALTLLRQAAADVRLIKGERRDLGPSTKTKIVSRAVAKQMKQGRKTLVFSTWTSHLDLLDEGITQESPNASIARIDGSMNRKAKREVQHAFKNGEIDVLSMTMKAGGRALNLPEADDCFLCQSWWNPFIARQAAYRAVRRGQTKTIRVSSFVVKDTIEERLEEVQEHKKQLSHSVLRPNGQGAGSLKMKEILSLIDRSSITTGRKGGAT